MVALRFIAGLFVLVAVLALTADATKAVATGAIRFGSLFEYWERLSSGSLRGFETLVTTKVHPLAWSVGVRKVLSIPAGWLFLGAGLLMAYIGRRRRRVNIYAN